MWQETLFRVMEKEKLRRYFGTFTIPVFVLNKHVKTRLNSLRTLKFVSILLVGSSLRGDNYISRYGRDVRGIQICMSSSSFPLMIA
jgi:hypothetical protein